MFSMTTSGLSFEEKPNGFVILNESEERRSPVRSKSNKLNKVISYQSMAI